MAAPKTVKTYPLAGTNRDFEIPFEYLARKFVIVTLIGTDRKELILNVDYRFTQRTIITLTRVWGPEEGYNFIEIKRVTSATERLVDFSDGSILRASDLNTATVQALHIAEEGRDIATDTIGVDNNGQLDARGRQIKNLADGVDDGDAISMRQIRAYDTSALNSRNAAKVSETNAKTSETNAAASRSAATTSAAAALVSQNASKASETASAASATNSQKWAAQSEDVVVSNGLYSSFHYSRKAAASAAASAASAAASAASAASSLTQADRATTEADRAKAEADKLGNMNDLGGAIEAVNGVVVTWKGAHIWRSSDLHMYSPTTTARFLMRTDGGAKWGAVSYNGANGSMYLTDSGGKTRHTWTSDGDSTIGRNMYVNGAIVSHGGSVSSNAPIAGSNTHVWLNDEKGTERALIWATPSGELSFRTDAGRAMLRMDKAGSIALTGSNGSSTLYSNGNIQSVIFGDEGNLHGAMFRIDRPRKWSEPVVIVDKPRPGTYIFDFPNDVWTYGSLYYDYSDHYAIVINPGAFANIPVGKKFYITASPYYIGAQWLDTNTSQRRILQMTSFPSGAPGPTRILAASPLQVVR